jgi:hypothetical protein
MNDSRFDQKQGDNTPIYDDPFEEENRKTRMRFFVMGGIGIIFCLLAVLGLPGVLRKSNLPIAAEFAHENPNPQHCRHLAGNQPPGDRSGIPGESLQCGYNLESVVIGAVRQ